MNSDTKSLSTASGNAVGHTPGPWTAILDKPNSRRIAEPMALVVTTAGHMAIDCTRSGESYRQDCANARLIAAAPDLLAALKELTDPARGMVSIPQSKAEAFERAYAAIAKAEGR